MNTRKVGRRKPSREERYRTAVALPYAFRPKVETLLLDILTEAGIEPHSITARVKEMDSAFAKLEKKADNYNDISDLTDLLGVRIITYFADSVDKVAEHIRDQFSVDNENSVDKRADLDSDRFGYLSLHYVVSLSGHRITLPEYKRFDGLKFEIQIRSILQHAWAEIEHDLGYKTEGGIPSPARRRFSRLGALLEIADDEFKSLKVELGNYEAEAQEVVAQTATYLEINQATLALAITSRPDYIEMDEALEILLELPLTTDADNSYVAKLVQDARWFGLRELDSLNRLLRAYGDHIIAFASRWLARSDHAEHRAEATVTPRGIGVYYLMIILGLSGPQGIPTAWNWVDRDDFEAEANDIWREVIEERGPLPDLT